MIKPFLRRLRRGECAFPRGDRWLGVKLGHTAVKIAVLRKDRERIVLEDFGFLEVLPPGAEGRNTAVAEALQELTARIDHRGLRTCLVMDGAHVDVSFVRVPSRIPEREFKQVALLQADAMGPNDPERLAWDAVRQGAPLEDLSPALVAVSSRDRVSELERVLSGAGLKPDVITVAPLTFGTLVPRGHTEGNVAVMDIGARSTAVAVFQGEKLLYARDTRVGSDPITDEIAALHQGDRALAESLKRNWVLPAPGETLQPILVGGEPYLLDPERIESVCQMREELLRTLRYIQDRVGLPISRLVLTGGGSRLGGLVGYLNLPPTIQTGVVDPLAVLDDVAKGINRPLLDSVSHRLTQAIGAAHLGIHALPSRRLNLLARHAAQAAAPARRPASRGWVRAAAYGVLLIASVAVLVRSAESYFARSYQAIVEARAANESGESGASADPAASFHTRGEPGADAIRALASCVPARVRLERIESAHVSTGPGTDDRADFLDPELDVLFASQEAGSADALLLRVVGQASRREDLVGFLDALTAEGAFAGARLEWTKRPEIDPLGASPQYMGFSVLILVAGAPAESGAGS